MIQRIQSIYLLVVFVAGCLYLVYNTEVSVDFFLILVSSILALVVIFLYKNRKGQFLINRINILLNLILLGVFAYRALIASGEDVLSSKKGVEMLLPLFSIVFLFLSNKAIKRDEELVKSADRLR